MLYNNLSAHLKSRYGKKIKKICIDGGFSCPNRDGTCGIGGCIFCGERGAGEHIDGSLSIEEQVASGLSGARPDTGYIAYFQNFTNTYADAGTLKSRYDKAISDSRIVALSIGTRPDCIDEERAKLIASYKDRLDVWVELGLQTSSDRTAKIINRGYESRVFTEAVEILTRHKIPIVTHLMLGLPNEGDEELRNTVDFINAHPISGIKLHSVYVMDSTKLCDMYRSGEYQPISREAYIKQAIYLLTHISPELIIHRLVADCPKDRLVAPDWNKDKNATLKMITDAMEGRGLYQGIYYNK